MSFDVRLAAGSRSGAFESALGRAARFRLPGHAGESALRIAGGDPDASLLLRRASSRDPAVQMPPLGTRLPDTEALGLLEAWIREDLADSAGLPLPIPECCP
jgi:hypothetical protein